MPAPHQLRISTRGRTQMVDITDQVRALLEQHRVSEGIVTLYCPHTTAGLTINEHADPDVVTDLLAFLDELVPRRRPAWRHAEGNSDAHMKASLMGSSVRVLAHRGRMLLGRWQGIFFCEFDGPRQREVWVALEPSSDQEKT